MKTADWLSIILATVAAFAATTIKTAPAVVVIPPAIPLPAPQPVPPAPRKPFRPAHLFPTGDESDPFAGATIGPKSPKGVEPQIDLPDRLQEKNVGGSDGSGLCVFDSMHHAGRWAGEPAFSAIFEWMKRHPGGGYPEKVDAMLKQLCAEKKLRIPNYVQIEDNDLEILKLACRNGIMPCVTYSYSPTGRYNGQRIAHMVNLENADDDYFAVLDNNYIGANNLEWLTPKEFAGPYAGGRLGWCVLLTERTPPPAPHNRKAS